jgi:predicted nucleotidyltransferase
MLSRLMRPEAQLVIDDQALAAVCERNHIRRLAFFGSVLRSDFRPDSDVDILVEFEPGHVPGFAFAGLQEELSQIIGRTVDLHTSGSLSRHFREKVEHEAQVHYAGTTAA